MITVCVHQICHDLYGLAWRFGSFKGHIDQRTIVHYTGCVFQLVTATPGAFRDCQTVFVHIAYSSIGFGYFGYLAEIAACVPFNDLPHRAWRMFASGAVVEFTVKRMAVGGIGDKHRAVRSGVLTCDKARACQSRLN